jgi:hypothetical protein
VPIIGIDFSLANLTFEAGRPLIHTLKPGEQNDYVDTLTSLFSAFSQYSRYTVAYGMGAKTLPGENNPTCQLFSLTGDYSDPFIENEE